jgi:hypothetical protein
MEKAMESWIEPVRAQKERHDDGMEGDEGQDDFLWIVMARRLDLGRHGQHGQHCRERTEAIELACLGEAGRVPGVLYLRPPDRNEERDEQRAPCDRRFVVQGVRDGADRDDEAEIEEELEPRSPSLWFGQGALRRHQDVAALVANAVSSPAVNRLE